MKKILLVAFVVMIAKSLVFGQSLNQNTTVRACMFLHPEDGAYFETYLIAGANALKYVPVKPRGFATGVDVQILITQGDKVLNFDKYRLNTPTVYDTAKIDFSIIDQKRLFVPNVASVVEVKITDINDSLNSFTYTEVFSSFMTGVVQISDIQFADTYKMTSVKNNFTKNGVELQPYPLNFFPSGRNSIIFYGEVYNTDKYLTDDQFMITYSIKNASTDEFNQQFYQYTKADKQPVFSFVKEMDIADLPGGNYNLIVEVRNKKNELLAMRKVFIQRANAGAINNWENIQMINTSGTFADNYTEEQLNYFLDVIKPVASESDRNLIESLSDRVEPDMKKKFLYNFWVERNQVDPYAEWLAYLDRVKEVNSSFGTPSRPGYKTDRGRVFLQYGRPYDVVTSVNEPGAYPYEIWFYTTLPDKQTNIGFAFYEPSMVSNDYILMHSNARGEINDERWTVKLYENVASPSELMDFDNTKVEDKIGGYRAVDMYEF
ncbi:MAG: GWxTD domain-containing protein [Bacteroidetes bacterium]|nr:GWxTD domain-containing protein [Bacteroidota bacterium]